MDPLSRKHLSPSLIYNNLNLKYSIDEFLTEEPWAFEYQAGQKAEDIAF